MHEDENTPKAAQELKELTKVVRSIDLDSPNDNEKMMVDANGDHVFYHPDYMPEPAKTAYLESLKKPPKPKTSDQLEREEREIQRLAGEGWSEEEEKIAGEDSQK